VDLIEDIEGIRKDAHVCIKGVQNWKGNELLRGTNP